MSRKKILIVNPISVYPIEMASQRRIHDLVKYLSIDHTVDLLTLYSTEEGYHETRRQGEKRVNRLILIPGINYGGWLRKKIIGLIYLVNFLVTGISKREFYYSNWFIRRKINSQIKHSEYDIVQVEYWYQANIFRNVSSSCIKVIDNHGLMYKKKELEYTEKYKGKIPLLYRRELKRYRRMELKHNQDADICLAISEEESKEFRRKVGGIVWNVPIGVDIAHFTTYEYKPEEDTILFYGSMGSQQNRLAFSRFVTKILPEIVQKRQYINLILLGANPPTLSYEFPSNTKLIVTGFVDDVRPWVSKAKLKVLPLEIGAGFRGRALEVMALGVPIVGTSNALDCLGLSNGKEGIISNNNKELAESITKLLDEKKYHDYMSCNAKEFVVKNYSIDKTYRSLSRKYKDL